MKEDPSTAVHGRTVTPSLSSLAGGHCVDEIQRHSGALAERAALQVGQPLR